MQIVQIQQDDNNGFVCVVPASVHVIPVTDIDEANKTLQFLVKGQLKKLDVEFDPITLAFTTSSRSRSRATPSQLPNSSAKKRLSR